ncbi:hypothetical protein [Antrihabitans sp. YC2-6]|uniref:hypothetical protein n=1 Tax=Antrihabitans sp. YC2-6 TaxID=2799498 RepID=UPI0018F39D8D|nr:hypothetical protein [Antrihabitans sp. YC2-6]MBJ8344828.1 hypothetical protein [Antrihabitans sp. YC2-6]
MAGSQRFAWRRMVVRDPHLSDATRRVLLELESYADKDGNNARPGVMKMAEALRTEGGKHGHLSERTVRTGLAHGVDRGLIELTHRAPRGRGNRRADVYRIVLPPEIEATQTAGNTYPEPPPEIEATQTAGNKTGNTGNRRDKYRQSDPLNTGNPDCQPPVGTYVPPDPFPPEGDLTFGNAYAREEEKADPIDVVVIDDSLGALFGKGDAAQQPQPEPTPKPAIEIPTLPNPYDDPLGWIDRQLQQGFLKGERDRAEQLLTEGHSYGDVRFTLIRERRPGKRRTYVPRPCSMCGSLPSDPNEKRFHQAQDEEPVQCSICHPEQVEKKRKSYAAQLLETTEQK